MPGYSFELTVFRPRVPPPPWLQTVTRKLVKRAAKCMVPGGGVAFQRPTDNTQLADFYTGPKRTARTKRAYLVRHKYTKFPSPTSTPSAMKRCSGIPASVEAGDPAVARLAVMPSCLREGTAPSRFRKFGTNNRSASADSTAPETGTPEGRAVGSTGSPYPDSPRAGTRIPSPSTTSHWNPSGNLELDSSFPFGKDHEKFRPPPSSRTLRPAPSAPNRGRGEPYSTLASS